MFPPVCPTSLAWERDEVGGTSKKIKEFAGESDGE